MKKNISHRRTNQKNKRYKKRNKKKLIILLFLVTKLFSVINAFVYIDLMLLLFDRECKQNNHGLICFFSCFIHSVCFHSFEDRENNDWSNLARIEKITYLLIAYNHETMLPKKAQIYLLKLLSIINV